MKVVAALFAAALLATACSPASPAATQQATSSPSSAPTQSASELSAETVAIGAALAQMRGHHNASLQLHEAGDIEGAIAHASHPAAEILESIRSDLDEAQAPTDELEAALAAVLTSAETDSSEGHAAAIDAATDLIDATEAAVAGEHVDTPAYVGSVIASILQTAGHEYEEAVADGTIGELIEYQDAWAFTQEAFSQYGVIEEVVTAASAEEAEEIQEAFETLFLALQGVEPPSTVRDVEEVEAAAALIGHELEETVGALPATESDPAAEQEAIEALLDEIVAEVEAGNREAAAELAAEAYLEHYEVIEGGVIEAAPEINEQLEPLLGAELRRQINEGATLEEIQAMVATAKMLLAQAIEALEQH